MFKLNPDKENASEEVVKTPTGIGFNDEELTGDELLIGLMLSIEIMKFGFDILQIINTDFYMISFIVHEDLLK